MQSASASSAHGVPTGPAAGVSGRSSSPSRSRMWSIRAWRVRNTSARPCGVAGVTPPVEDHPTAGFLPVADPERVGGRQRRRVPAVDVVPLGRAEEDADVADVTWRRRPRRHGQVRCPPAVVCAAVEVECHRYVLQRRTVEVTAFVHLRVRQRETGVHGPGGDDEPADLAAATGQRHIDDDHGLVRVRRRRGRRDRGGAGRLRRLLLRVRHRVHEAAAGSGQDDGEQRGGGADQALHAAHDATPERHRAAIAPRTCDVRCGTGG